MDRPAFRRCRSLGGVRCYRLPAAATNGTDDLSSEQMYMSGGFIRMMWRRIRLLGDVLRHGYSFAFTVLSSNSEIGHMNFVLCIYTTTWLE
jgi:hypothetical protein